ncbi:MAG: helix-turn-helix transcriptional regulator [Dyadobacter sp.]
MFTKREIEIIWLIARGLKSKAVAEVLCVSTETIKSHRKNILEKVREDDKEISLLEFCIQYPNEHKKSPLKGD